MNNLLRKTTKMIMLSAFLVGLGTQAHAKKVIKWKLATTWGPTLTPFIDAPRNMAKMVEEMSDGRFIIRIDASNKHKAALGILDMVKAGQYDMGHSASYYWKGKDINTLPFTAMPFGMTTPEQYSWFYHGGGLELMQKAYKKHKVYSFPGGNAGSQMGGWFRKEIKSVKDLKGLRMRIPGFSGEIMADLGLSVTNIASGELYTSLERGTIDALEWVGPGMDINMGFHKVAPYYYTGWHEPGAELQFLVNQKKYNKLPKDLQQILKFAMKLSAYDMYIQNYHMNVEAWSGMKKDYPNIQIKSFPKEVLDAMKASNKKLLAEKTKNEPFLKEVLDSQDAYKIKAREWTKISDYLYLKDN